jgi:hypothetical protein
MDPDDFIAISTADPNYIRIYNSGAVCKYYADTRVAVIDYSDLRSYLLLCLILLLRYEVRTFVLPGVDESPEPLIYNTISGQPTMAQQACYYHFAKDLVPS